MSEENKIVSEEQKTEARRDFMKKTAYIAPVVVTMGMTASFAAYGSSDNTGAVPYGYAQPTSRADCAVGGPSEFYTGPDGCTG